MKKSKKENAMSLSTRGMTLVEIVISTALLAIILAGLGYAIEVAVRAGRQTVVKNELLGRVQSQLQQVGEYPWDADPGGWGWPHAGTMDYAIYHSAPITFTYDDIPGNGTIIVTNDIDGNPGTTWNDSDVPAIFYDGTYNLCRVNVKYVTNDGLEVELEDCFFRP